uniref:Capsid protein n=1 Tax=Alphatorquevirus homin21 TaxID=3048423 RepID=A0AAU7SSV4_9VIRU
MAWTWWWWRRRGRRRPWRRRRWRRLRPRRTRRTVRRRRRRTTVRRRRWRGRRGRRTYYRRRLKKRRRKRKKLPLTQWNPSTIRRCIIKGMIPMIICGHTTAGRNYALRSDDYISQNRPYGGSFSTTTWSLKVLFDEYQKFHNRWSYPNTQLDLARYKGATFYFYRDKKTDFIVTFNTVPPFKINKYSSCMYHPGMLMMQAKKRILIPSFDTKPRGRKRIKVRLKPPTLFEDKWYTQNDLCDVNLLSFAVTAASFTHPFCPPQTDNTCITFQVLKDFYYPNMSISPQTATQDDPTFDALYSNCTYFQTLHTPAQLNATVKGAQYNEKIPQTDWLSGQGPGKFTTGNNSIFGFCNYNPDKTKLHEIRKWYFNQENKDNNIHGTYGKPTNNALDYHLGKYSPIFLSPHRTNLQFPTAYQDVTYNPLNDKGKGNQIWFQYCTKPTTEFNEKQCKCHLKDLPLWCMFHGYSDYIESELGIQQEIHNIGIVCVISPYTQPKLMLPNKPNWGLVFYDTTFGDGKMPNGSGLVPVYLQNRWYPRMAFQQQVMHDFSLTGPYSYKDDLQSTVLTVFYKFHFLWGGNMIPEQVIRNPCKADGLDATYPSRLPRDLQIVDPRTVGPKWVFHTWDYRRGLFGEGAIKRVSEKPEDDEYSFQLPKKPRLFPPTDREGQEGGFNFQGEIIPPSSDEEADQEALQEEATEGLKQQQQLRQQLRNQQRMGQQLKQLFVQVLKTQAGVHLNPMLLAHA